MDNDISGNEVRTKTGYLINKNFYQLLTFSISSFTCLNLPVDKKYRNGSWISYQLAQLKKPDIVRYLNTI